MTVSIAINIPVLSAALADLIFSILQPDASVGADYMNRIALKRLRQYRVISDAEKACLIDVLCKSLFYIIR
jgi:hypothetical protein